MIPYREIKALFLDMDGVLWRSMEPIGDLKQIFTDIRAMGIIPLFGSNNATKTTSEYVQKMASFGVECAPEQFFSSAVAAAFKLREDFPDGARVHVLGTDSLKATIREAGFELADREADVVLVSMDWQVTYDKIAAAMTNIMDGARFYATNGDKTFPTAEGWRPGSGMVVAAVEACSGVEPYMIGKPNSLMIRMACEKWGLEPDEVIAVGDRHETDILSGVNGGAHTVLVMTGYETPETLPKLDPQPDLVCQDLTDLVELLKQERS